MTQQCKKQVEEATAEYKVRLDASEKRNEASDNEIQQLKNYHSKIIEYLKLEKIMTQQCKKQVEEATADYKIEIAELKSKDQIKDAKLEALDKEIHKLESENLIFRKELDKIKAKLSL
ncbi:hypothetical protein FQA39_LY12808 [Lamprigera yunnana]|nr:hypothetical protein FQA39_LY12808 [Lamprigera yunnana]